MSRQPITITIMATLALGVCLLSVCGPVAIGQEGGQAVKSKDPFAGNGISIKDAEVKLIDEVQLAATRSGILDFVEAREGDRVQKGQKVAGLKDQVARAELAVAKSEAENDVNIRFATESYEAFKVEYDAIVDANKRSTKTYSRSEVEKRRLEVVKAGLQIEQAERDLKVAKEKVKQAEAMLEEYSIVAPFDGVVTKVFKSKGEAVREGEVVLVITSTTRLKVEGFVHFKDAVKIKQGAPVSVKLTLNDGSDALPPELNHFQGRIKFVSPVVDGVGEDVQVWAEVENSKGLMRPGLEAVMTVEQRGVDQREASR